MKLRFIKNTLIIISIFCCVNGAFAIKLQKPVNNSIYGYSGDGQTQNAGKIAENPIRVLVTDDNNNPIRQHELIFTIISNPKGAIGQRIDKTIVCTDSLGIAVNYFQVGDKDGAYQILVSSNEDCKANTLVYQVNARKSSWLVFLIFGLFGGLSIYLYGMDQLSKGMQAVAGNRMRNLIAQFTKNRFLSLLAGIIVTLLVQSSSATSVMLVGFVEAGLMSFAQTLGMLLGAGIGTTITAQLIALKITDYSLLFVAIGFGFIFFSKKMKFNNIGKAILGFGLLFLGMYVMSESMYPLRTYDSFFKLLINLENPIIGILVGFLFTALIHSSAAFIGIMITIASQGFLSLDACIPLILGTNLGTGMTAIVASINSGKEAQKVAFAHTFFKLIGVFLFVWWIPEYAELVRSFSPKTSLPIDSFEALSQTVPRQIANAHTVFSVGLAILILPFTNAFSKLIEFFMRRTYKGEEDRLTLKYINSAISSSPAIALSLAKKETERMSDSVKEMVKISLIPFFERNESILVKWQKIENECDFLKENIDKYLMSVSSENSDEYRLNEAFQIMYVVKELEMIADIVNTNIRHQAVKWLSVRCEFSEEGKTELCVIQEKALKQISRSVEVFKDVNLEKAERVKMKSKKYSLLAEEFEKHHYERLFSKMEKSIGSSEVHLELIGLLNAINRHATNISRILLNWNGKV